MANKNEIAEYLMQNGQDLKDLGLMHGKMGVSLYFYRIKITYAMMQ